MAFFPAKTQEPKNTQTKLLHLKIMERIQPPPHRRTVMWSGYNEGKRLDSYVVVRSRETLHSLLMRSHLFYCSRPSSLFCFLPPQSSPLLLFRILIHCCPLAFAPLCLVSFSFHVLSSVCILRCKTCSATAQRAGFLRTSARFSILG